MAWKEQVVSSSLQPFLCSKLVIELVGRDSRRIRDTAELARKINSVALEFRQRREDFTSELVGKLWMSPEVFSPR